MESKQKYVYHYSFQLMDPAFGHLTVKISGHPPVGAWVILAAGAVVVLGLLPARRKLEELCGQSAAVLVPASQAAQQSTA